MLLSGKQDHREIHETLHNLGAGTEARESWLEKRREEVLDVPCFQVAFTIPERLNALVLHAPEILYAILLRAAGQALTDVAASKLRAHIPTGTFLLAVKVLSRRFRTLVKNAITEAYDDGSLEIPPHIARDRTALDLLLACASKTDWHSYVKPPFGGPEQVLAYLASYTHRVAISNQRIIAFDGERVTFRYRDYHDGNAAKSMELPAVEFLRRFLLHVVPARFTRIRYYGFLANRDRSANIEKARALIGSARILPPRAPAPDPRLCPQCRQGTMRMRAKIDPQRRRTWFDSS